MAENDYPRSFWRRYAERHSCTPKASRFRGENWNRVWGAGWAAHYDFEGVGFKVTVTQYLSKTGVVTYLSYGQGEEWNTRLVAYQKAFKDAFNAKTDKDGRLCATRLVLPGGVSNPKNWDLMIDWMEYHRQEYERILSSQA